MSHDERVQISVRHGDCRDALRELPDASVDAVVTDPPYELKFMGKSWDGSGIAYDVGLWRECLRVLKPGGHLLAFGGTRTWHRLACAIEDAGFQMRDSMAWLYGSGFPKSLDVSKAIDKAAGVEREVVGSKVTRIPGGTTYAQDAWTQAARQVGEVDITAAATDAAKQWEGWGTALKPAFEPIVVARKPLSGTVAATVLEHGTGALNIDGCRVGDGEDGSPGGRQGTMPQPMSWGQSTGRERPDGGRWPTNVLLDETQAAELDAQTGASGGASRFFPVFKYQAKAPAGERPKVDGVTHATVKPLELMRWLVRLITPPRGLVVDPFAGSGTTGEACALEGFRCLMIESAAAHLPLIRARIDRVEFAIVEPIPKAGEQAEDCGVTFGAAARETVLRCVARAQVLIRDLYRTAAQEDLRKARAGLTAELQHIARALSDPEGEEQTSSAGRDHAGGVDVAQEIWEAARHMLLRMTTTAIVTKSDKELSTSCGGDLTLTTAARGALVDGGLIEPVIPEGSTPRRRLWRATDRGRALARALRSTAGPTT